MTIEESAATMFEALEETGLPFMLVGGLSCNVYSIPRSTKDVDIVIDVESPARLRDLEGSLPAEFEFDGQLTFEAITGNVRHIVRIDGSPFVIELFELRKGDDFQEERFRRRRELSVPGFERPVPVPTAEDVVVQKLRWARPKDLDDARGVMTVQGNRLDRGYIEDWCQRLGILERYEDLRDTVPEI